jgi:hypothetical protein
MRTVKAEIALIEETQNKKIKCYLFEISTSLVNRAKHRTLSTLTCFIQIPTVTLYIQNLQTTYIYKIWGFHCDG